MTTKKPKISTVELDDIATTVVYDDLGALDKAFEEREELFEDMTKISRKPAPTKPTVKKDTELFGVADDRDKIEVESLIVDVEEDTEFLTWLLYGRNGTGKTTILSTTDGCLILAADDGTLALRGKTDAKRTKKVKVDTWNKIEQTYWLLKGGTPRPDGIEINVGGTPFTVKTVAFDTITKLAETCLRHVVLGEKARDASMDIMKPTMAHWGQMSQRMKYWLNLYNELPIQKVWLCQEKTSSENTDSDDFSAYPDVNNALRNFIQSEADIIGRTFIHTNDEGEAEFRLLVRPDQTYMTKDRTNKLPGEMRNPNLDKMYKRVFSA